MNANTRGMIGHVARQQAAAGYSLASASNDTDALSLPIDFIVRDEAERREMAQRGGVHIDYSDKGCEASPKCLECPLVGCKFDYAPGAYGQLANAIEDTWKAGLRPPGLVEIYPGPVSRIPSDARPPERPWGKDWTPPWETTTTTKEHAA